MKDYTKSLVRELSTLRRKNYGLLPKKRKTKKGKKEELIGKCILVHLSPKEVNVALVPTQSGQNLQEAIAQVQQIYEKVGVTLHITTEKPFDISDQLKNGTLPTENEFGDLSTYSPEQMQSSLNLQPTESQKRTLGSFITFKR